MEGLKKPWTTFWLLIVGGFIALPTSVIVYNQCRIAIKAGQYSKAVFHVEEVGISSSGGGRHGRISHRWAKGILNGDKERIGLSGFGFESSSIEDLKKEIPPGTELEVWYDPSAADIQTQGRTLKVIPRSTNLKSAWIKAILFMVLFDGLLIAGIVGYVRCRMQGIRVFR